MHLGALTTDLVQKAIAIYQISPMARVARGACSRGPR